MQISSKSARCPSAIPNNAIVAEDKRGHSLIFRVPVCTAPANARQVFSPHKVQLDLSSKKIFSEHF